ncbi:MAG: hypothetical protein C4331_03030 [Meiothermus sp.]
MPESGHQAKRINAGIGGHTCSLAQVAVCASCVLQLIDLHSSLDSRWLRRRFTRIKVKLSPSAQTMLISVVTKGSDPLHQKGLLKPEAGRTARLSKAAGFGPVLLGLALAQAQPANPYAQFLAPLKSYPGLVQALHGTQAAADQVEVLKSPIGVQASGGYSLLGVSPPDAGPCRPTDPSYQPNPACFPLPTSGSQASVGLNFTPFLAGDVGGKVAQANSSLAQAQLAQRQTLASLEAQAVQAAYRVKLAQNALELAKQGESVASLSVQATQTRLDKGGRRNLNWIRPSKLRRRPRPTASRPRKISPWPVMP